LADDFLDIKGKSKYTGKTVHKDKKKGKSTVINLAGYDYAYNYAIKLKKKILRNLEKHGKNANDLRDIVNFTLERKY
jgi:geranylgeranyl pyrophosphate synthase